MISEFLEIFEELSLPYVLIAVIMQAHRSLPPDMSCKDKFLIQSTVVPAGTTDEDITPEVVDTHSSSVSFTFFPWFLIEVSSVSSPRRRASLSKRIS